LRHGRKTEDAARRQTKVLPPHGGGERRGIRDACAQNRFFSFSTEKKRKSYKKRKERQGLFTNPPLDPPKIGGLARFGSSVTCIVSAPTSLIAYVVRVTWYVQANHLDKDALQTIV
jgi:hypothetical protein